MDLKAKIGQMIVVRASGNLFDSQRLYPQWEADNQTLQRWLKEFNLGGVILLGGGAVELQTRSRQLQAWANTPLLIAADIEEGVGQRFAGLTWLPPPMALSAITVKDLELARQYAYQMGEVTAQEAVSIGVNWLLAPVVDVNNNSENPVINIRAFGDRPEIVSCLTSAFIEGAKSVPILTTAKHFPGHGDTATDSHLDLPVLNHDAARLAEIELPPFTSAIAAGVDSVMTAHLTIPVWDSEQPATLSKIILTEKLRQEMGFTGLIVTDALIMGGITKYAAPEEVAIRAVESGVDILLMPDNPEVAINSIFAAVRTGRLSEERIEESCERIRIAKSKLNCLEGSSMVPSKPIQLEPIQLEPSEQGLALATNILQHSLRAGGNFDRQSFLPESNPQQSNSQQFRNLIVVDDVLNSSFLNSRSSAIAIPQQLGYQKQILDQNSLDLITKDLRPTLLQLFVRGNPFRGQAGLSPMAEEQYSQLVQSEHLRAIVVYGSPYVLDWFLNLIPADLPWIFSYGQMDIAQAIVLNALFSKEKIETLADDQITDKLAVTDFGF